jgi:hypothetical protein
MVQAELEARGGQPMTLTAAAAPRQVTMSAAINRALRDAMTADGDVVVFGEDVGTLGGVFASPTASPATSARTAASTPRSPRPASSASP